MKRKLACLLTSCVVAVAAAMPAFAAEEDTAVPSVAPESSPRIIAANVTIDGEDYDLEGLEELGLEMVVTPLSEKDNAVNDTIKAMLEEAEKDVNSMDLTFVKGADQDKFDSIKNDVTCSELVDVSIVYADTKEPYQDATNITFTLETANWNNIKALAHDSYLGWELISDVPTNAADGAVTISVSTLSPFAFFADKAAPSDSTGESSKDEGGNGGGGTSPSTGTTNGLLFAIPAVVAVAGGIVLVKRAKKN
ncbi:MAG: hypothetical protein IKO44_05050 [Ruminococcus sp.]|nr:hypothetical protein [Ruminococcus sp.]